ncbi:pyroglutamyl-peptidase I [Corynebacterium tuberculostearicum]|uniref:pyroglutamyl-peptidase I n=1 Tax=Corynebacterium tuberculostearicum TaxID=38304 RepID=UPI002934FD7F|nr:pyroglutamyl-peptidase I [Corynebacterium tuberculostearicum]MDV2431824.1 pyroglutamyl-peptidase I [Corynebacterium tuberculostearicum]
MKILVTAFDAFGGESINPTEQVLDHLPGRIGRAEISQLVVPTKFGESLRRVTEAAEEESADAVVCLGQAGGRERITPERVAINVMDAEIPDNAGYQPVDVPVVEGGPAAYFSTLPVKAMVKAIGDIPARLSNTAGTFVCNQLLYGLLQHFAGTDVQVGFVHVPYLKEQNKTNKPMMELEEIAEGVKRALWAVQAS